MPGLLLCAVTFLVFATSYVTNLKNPHIYAGPCHCTSTYLSSTIEDKGKIDHIQIWKLQEVKIISAKVYCRSIENNPLLVVFEPLYICYSKDYRLKRVLKYRRAVSSRKKKVKERNAAFAK